MDETQTIEQIQPKLTNHNNESKQTTSTKCKIHIKDKPITAIVDSGAATNIISNKLVQELNLENIKKSNATFIIANGERVAALGKISLPIEIANNKLTIETQVIESNQRTFIIGTELIRRLKANINYEKGEMQVNIEGNNVTIPIYFTKNENVPESDEESDEELYKDIENEEEYEEYEEYDDKSIAYYLASLEEED